MQPLAGGHSGETYLAETAAERTVARLYVRRGATRGPEAVVVDAAVLRLVKGLLPVPEVLEVVRPDPSADRPGLLVTSFLPGERLDLLLARAGADDRRTVGRALGTLLARLAGMPMPRHGLFVDGDLRIDPLPVGGGLPEWVEAHRTGTALAAWDEATFDRLRRVAATAQDLLDAGGRACLVHSDFNPKNILVDPATWTVTGLLDWEFAHAGMPVTDLGNLLRFERDPVLAGAVLETYRAWVPDAGPDLLDRARAADLFALVDLASRWGENPVTEQAHALLRAIARDGRLDAPGDDCVF